MPWRRSGGGGRPLADAIAPIPYLAFQQQLDAIAPHGAHGWSRACLRVLGVPLALACLVAVALTSLGACGRTAPGTPTGASLPAPPSFLPTPPAFPTGSFVAMTVSTFLRHGYTRPGDLCDADLVAVAAVARYGGAHWNSADGNRPASVTPQELTRRGYAVVTPMAFSQWLPLNDQRVGATREYAARGGRAGRILYTADPGPRPPDGHRFVMVFNAAVLANPSPNSRATDELMVLYAALPTNAQNEVYFGNPGVWMPLTLLAGQLATCAGNHAPTPTS